MNTQVKKKIRAVEMVLLLIISGSVGYVIISRQGPLSGRLENTPIQETIKTTDETPQNLKAHIKAGPLTGYAPLAVSFFGNPDNDSNIVSYQWDFGPEGTYILSESNYTKIVNKPIFKVANLFFTGYLILFSIIGGLIFLQMATSRNTLRNNAKILQNGASSMGILMGSFIILFITVVISNIIGTHQARLDKQYTSTERDPIMVFLGVGSYSATLTVTDTQGKTSTDTIWITVLQYVPPDYDNDMD
jgi:hypothetical protein